jgi:hypothetical protein
MNTRHSPVIVRLQGGLGNQLYQYALGRALSIRTGRPLLLDTRLISGEPYRSYALSVFNIKQQHVYGVNKWCTRWATSIRAGRLFRLLCPFAWNYLIIQDKEAGFDPSIFTHKKGTLVLQGYWQSYKYFEAQEDIIRSEFTLKKAPEAENACLIDEIENTESVAVHVRRGDYEGNATFNATLGTCTLQYYRHAAEHVKQKVNNPCFFVFSDDPGWTKQNLRLPGPTRIVDHNFGKADFEDLRLITHCKHFIIANSSFSWWGAWLASYPAKIVITPKRWFKIDHFPPEDRIPREWLRL